ncbi:hypothetical protein SNOG_06137 [Parastagonospora nodorum SN15]|uniref:Defect at low temperature protein 1 n=1 Tax=Phaeosphaeria nodorum (strain SN15 / ATCC MYA-4574 / FGSC 10173) TaxID=321614 RepID=Q0UQ27_PHANO|nr:hypothetical protein SNOG_06137 [Parastagonospora nodorum SN15]EAT85968.2 hypothetical protein SNOG_06137 [Parastagonospora nodorum SN15]
MRIPLFRIWYSTTYTTILILLLLILAVAPADTIYQSVKSKELQKLFVIGGVYFLTFSIVLLIYSTRIYTNRYGEVGKGVRRMIAKELRRSAIVAWDSRPRDLRREEEGRNGEGTSRPNTAEKEKDKGKAHKKKKSDDHGMETTILPVTTDNPPWGYVSHPGWASPSSPDLPNLQYWSVICELPNLIEAKAVSLAPPDPAVEDAALQYPDNAAPSPRRANHLGATFLAQYEYARFSTASLTEPEFRNIMAVFADILNGMAHLDQDVIDEARAQSIASDTHGADGAVASAATESDGAVRCAAYAVAAHAIRDGVGRDPSQSVYDTTEFVEFVAEVGEVGYQAASESERGRAAVSICD